MNFSKIFRLFMTVNDYFRSLAAELRSASKAA
jgi:hypothetical protein